MKIRSSHVTAAVVFAIAGFAVLVVLREGPAPSTEGATDASLPPVDASFDSVPQLEITDRFEMGLVPNDVKTVKPLTFRNTGKRPLVISDINTSCACTLPALDPNSTEVAPGQEGTIHVTFDPFRVPGFESTKLLTLFANDPSRPTVEVEVHTLIEPEFELIPDSIDFGAVEKGEGKKATILMRQLWDTPLEITELLNPDGTLEAPVPAHTSLELSFQKRPEDTWRQPGKVEYEVYVSLTPEVPPGKNTWRFTIINNVQRVKGFPVVVQADVQAPYSIDYHRASFDFRTGKHEGTIEVSAKEPLELLDVHGEPGCIEVRTEQVSPTSAKMVFSVADTAYESSLDGFVLYTVQCAGKRHMESQAISVRKGLGLKH